MRIAIMMMATCIARAALAGGGLPSPDFGTGTPIQAGIEASQTGFPRVAVRPDSQSSFVLVYTQGDDSDFNAATVSDVFMELRSTADGALLAGPTKVNDSGLALEPEVAWRPDGSGFIVVWAEKDSAGETNPRQISYQRFDSAGAIFGTSSVVHTGPQDAFNAFPDIAIAADGTVAIAFEGPDSIERGIRARRYDTFNLPIDTNDAAINQNSTGDEFDGVIAYRPNGELILAYQGSSGGFDPVGDTIADEVFASRLSGTLAPLTADVFVANTYMQANGGGGDIQDPEIAVAPDGSFMIAYEAEPGGGDQQIFAMSYSASGAPALDSFQVVNELAGDQQDVAIAYHAASAHYAIVWGVRNLASASYNNGTVIKFVDANGTPARLEEKVSSTETTRIEEAHIDIQGDTAVVAWRERSTADHDVWFRVFQIDTLVATDASAAWHLYQ